MKLNFKLILLITFALTGVALSSASTNFNHWLAGTSAPDVAKFNSSWYDLSGKSDTPSQGIYSGTYTDDYFFLGGGNSEFTLFNGTFDRYTQSESPFKNKVSGLSSNSTHVYVGTEQPDNYLYDIDSRSFTDLGVQSDGSSIQTVENSYSADIGGDYFLFGTQNPSVWKWNGSFHEISPGFFVNTIGDSGRNSTHIMVGDTNGVIGIYNGSNWTDISSKLGFENNHKVFSIEYGNFGAQNFFLIGGSSGHIERLWTNGTSEDLSGKLGGSWEINSIGFDDEKDRFMIGGASGNIYVYNKRGFFENTPKFSWQNNVNFIDYNPFGPPSSPDETSPNVSILKPKENQIFSSRDINLSVNSDQEIVKWNYNIDSEPNNTAGMTGTAFVDSGGNLKVVYGDGSVNDFNVNPRIIAGTGNLDEDKYNEVPYVDGTGNLKIIDKTGENSTLDTGLSASKLIMATGKWKDGKDYIFYPDQSDNGYIKKIRSGSSEETIGTGIASNGVIGPGDFNRDGDKDIVFVGTSDTIKWYDDGTVGSTGFSSFGSNNQKGLGKVTDLDNDGNVRVPYVTGSNNIALIDYTGGKTVLNNNYGEASKTRIAAVDWRRDSKKEIIHLDSSNNELRFMFLNGESKYVKDRNYSEIQGDTSSGLAVGNQRSINQTIKNVDEGVRNLTVHGFDGKYNGEDIVEFTIDITGPVFQNFGDNVTSSFFRPDTANISTLVKDQYSGVNEVKLETNETESFTNKSKYGSPENYNNISSEYIRSSFLWSNKSFYNDNLSYRIYAEDTAGNVASTELNSFYVNKIDLSIGEIYFNESNPVEKTDFKVKFNVSNQGSDSVSVGVNLTEETYNGTKWIKIDEKSENLTFNGDTKKTSYFVEEAEIGPRKYTVDIDTDDEVEEENDSNNENSSIIDISGNQIYYGETTQDLVLGSQNTGLKDWNKPVDGNIFYSDNDAEYYIGDLKPLNQTGDLVEATESLNITGHNDSISEDYDSNGDGKADFEKCVNIAGDEICEVPFTNSTNTSNFQTGIIYDSDDGTPYDGTQDLVFITRIVNPEKQGKYGKYNYESRIPSNLALQTGNNDKFVGIRQEIK